MAIIPYETRHTLVLYVNIFWMEKKFIVADLKPGQTLFDEPFALSELEKKSSQQGKIYYNIGLSDKTGEIHGKIWSEALVNCDLNAKIGEIVKVTGSIQEYNGKTQIVVDKMSVTTEIAPAEFLPVTTRDRSQMKEDLKNEIDKIENQDYKKLLLAFWEDTNNLDRYSNFPAAEYVHHAYVGGLLEHVWEMYQLSRAYKSIYPNLDWDLFFTGLFFHDIGKLEELDIVGAAIIRTNAGRLIAHIGQGILFIDRLISNTNSDFDTVAKDKLFHLILSHQGELEYGSPVRPQMVESLILSMVDANSASINQATKHIEKSIVSGEDFTEYHKWLGRSFYQKDYLPDATKDQ